MGSLLVTIDAEEDDAWAGHPETTTRNAAFLPRFQALCEAHGIAPTYLTNYEMACDPVFVEFARDALARGTAEIGMHLHAWNSPPLVPLGHEDFRHGPYLIEYPDDVAQRKVEFLTRFLEDTFSVQMVSHRAGRWALNAFYVRVLSEFGYKVDCSVTPHLDWTGHRGAPGGRGGSDYRGFPERSYWIGGDDISRPAKSDVLEVPMTIIDRAPSGLARIARSASQVSKLPERALRRACPVEWMRPNGHNLKSMLRIIDLAERERWPYIEFMLHSSELMPGGSPTFSTPDAVATLYDHLAAVFSRAASGFRGRRLAEFYDFVCACPSPN